MFQVKLLKMDGFNSGTFINKAYKLTYNALHNAKPTGSLNIGSQMHNINYFNLSLAQKQNI